MNASSKVERFGFDRVFTTQPVGRPADAASLQLEIEHLELEISRLRQELKTGLNVVRAEAFQAGLDHARTDTQAALLQAVDALQGSIECLEQRFEEADERISREGAEIALAAANHLAGRALALAPTHAIDEAIGRVLKQVRRGQPVQVRVHPDLSDAIQRAIDERQSHDRRRLHLTVIPDATIAIGDARFCWDSGEVSLNAEARLEGIRKEFDSFFPGD